MSFRKVLAAIAAVLVLLATTVATSQPATAQSTPATSVRVVVFGAGEWITQGDDYAYTEADGDWYLQPNYSDLGDGVQVWGSGWTFEFDAPGDAWLQTGDSFIATRFPFNRPDNAGLSVSSPGRGCNTSLGQFTVLEATYANDEPTSFAADFRFSCDGGAQIVGGVRINTTWPDPDPSFSLGLCAGELPTQILSVTGDLSVTRSYTDREVVLGSGQADVITTGSGDDLICGGSGSDIISSGGGDDVLFGGDGEDVLRGQAGIDQIHGEGAGDTIKGGGGGDTIYGGPGGDVIDAGGGVDTVNGDAGPDVINGQGAADMLHGGAGADEISGQNGADQIWGGSAGDNLSGQIGPDIFYGEAGDDIMLGGNGADTFYGGVGFDKCSGNIGNNDQAEQATCEQTPGIEILF